MNHLTSQQIESYHAGTLERAEEYLAIDAHLAGCATCRERLGPVSSGLPAGLRRWLADEAHPEAALLVRYTRDNSDVPAIVAQHVAVCTQCRQDVAALQLYRQAITPEIWAEARAVLETPAAQPGFGEWLRLSFLAAVSGRAFRSGVPVVAMCLLLIGILLWRNQRIVEITDDSGRWALTRAGRLTGPITLPPELEPALRKVLQDRRAGTPLALSMLTSPAEVRYSPAGTFVISDRPKLRWEAVPNAVSYQCTLTSPDDSHFKRGAPKPIPGTFWVLKKPLPRGKVYTWRVVATLRNGQHVALSGSPRFRVMEQAEAQALTQAAKTYVGSHLALGLLYAQDGALDEAEQEFAALLRLNPESEIIKAVLDRLRALHRAPG